MELKEPKWVKMTRDEVVILSDWRGEFGITLPNGIKGSVQKCNGELSVLIDGYQRLYVTSRCGSVHEKMDHPISHYVFKGAEAHLQWANAENLEQRQKQLEVLRLFEVQHDAGRQLPATSGSGQLP